MNISTNNICAIIITFNPDKDFLKRLKKIEEQVGFVIVVDNNSENNLLKKLKKTEALLLQNNTNLGIAKALNQGVSKAELLGYKWLVTFDQDSVIENDLIISLCEISLSIKDKLFVLGSNYWNTNKKGVFYNCNGKNKTYTERKTVITSGMFFHLNLIKKIGGFNSSYFIDSVDHEFCLRARSNNVKVYISCNPLMSHSIGNNKLEEKFLKNIVFSHSADRVYYMSRNTLITIKNYFFKEPVWALCQLIRLNVEFFAISFKKDRKKKIVAFLKGLRDSLLGRMGKINSAND